jgi:hypothetical protein
VIRLLLLYELMFLLLLRRDDFQSQLHVWLFLLLLLRRDAFVGQQGVLLQWLELFAGKLVICYEYPAAQLNNSWRVSIYKFLVCSCFQQI